MNGWQTAWGALAPLPAGASPVWLAALCLIGIFFLIVLPAATAFSFVERKLGADLQARVGPNRAGPLGIFQPIADILKLLEKGASPRSVVSGSLWFWIHTAALFSTLAVLPLGSMLVLLDTDLSALVPFWAALVVSLSTLLLGIRGAAGVPGWIGGFRVASQAISGAFPALVSIFCAAISAGSFRWNVIAESQGFSPLFWAIANPFLFVAFVVFMISGLIIFALPPLDAGFSSSDLHGGVASRFEGWRLVLMKLSRFYGLFLWSVIAVVLFLGAWTLPSSVSSALREAESWVVLAALELGWLFFKAFTLMILIQWVARTNPRSRVDQVTDFSWKVLGPFALFALFGAALWVSRGIWA